MPAFPFNPVRWGFKDKLDDVGKINGEQLYAWESTHAQWFSEFKPENNDVQRLEPPLERPEKSLTPLITEAGQSVLEVVGDEAVIRFKDFGRLPIVEASASATVQLVGNKSIEVADSEYNSELGVYHENEISGMYLLNTYPSYESYQSNSVHPIISFSF